MQKLHFPLVSFSSACPLCSNILFLIISVEATCWIKYQHVLVIKQLGFRCVHKHTHILNSQHYVTLLKTRNTHIECYELCLSHAHVLTLCPDKLIAQMNNIHSPLSFQFPSRKTGAKCTRIQLEKRFSFGGWWRGCAPQLLFKEPHLNTSRWHICRLFFSVMNY